MKFTWRFLLSTIVRNRGTSQNMQQTTNWGKLQTMELICVIHCSQTCKYMTTITRMATLDQHQSKQLLLR